MRALFFCFLLVMAGLFQQQKAAAQVVPVTIFYDVNGLITNKPNAAFIRVASLDTVAFVFKGTVSDYYTNGNPYRYFTYGPTGKEGAFQLFHPDKTLDRHGFFLANEPAGKWKFYYPDGKPLQTVEFLPNKNYSLLEYNDFLGRPVVKDGTGRWETTSRIAVGNLSMNLLLEGDWENGQKTGKWLFMQPDGKKVFEEEYENGVFKKGRLYDQAGKNVIKTNVDQEVEKWPFLTSLTELEKMSYNRTVFSTKEKALNYILRKEYLLPVDTTTVVSALKVEKPAEFPGGQAAMFQFMGSNFRIPKDDIRNRIDGTVVISFVVGTDGALSEVRVVKSLSFGIDHEAMRVIKMMPKWTPATQDGVPVPFKCTVPFRIRRM